MILNWVNTISTISRNLLIAGAVSVAAIIFATLWLYQTNAQSVSYTSSAAASQRSMSGTVYLSGKEGAKVEAASATVKAPVQEVHIANSGFTLVRGARVVAVEGTQIRVQVAWSATAFTWEVATDIGTKFYASSGEKETLAGIQVGDIVTVSGHLAQQSGEPVINADFVRESK